MKTDTLADALFVRSEELNALRHTIQGIEDFADLLGPIAEFALVIDANVIIRDLIWLCSKRKNPTAKSALAETVLAGTIIPYVPPVALREVTEKLPHIATRRRIDETALRNAWKDYQGLLRVEEPNPLRVIELRAGRDPDDAEYLALAETIGAKGILSHDLDISAMGGAVPSMDVVGYLRGYSRAAAIEFNIKVHGVVLMHVSAASLKAAVSMLRGLSSKLGSMPTWAKIGLVLLAILLLLNDKSRTKITQSATQAGKSLSLLMPGLLEVAQQVAVECQANKKRGLQFLEEAVRLISSASAEQVKKVG